MAEVNEEVDENVYHDDEFSLRSEVAMIVDISER
jgi:hypothetical protein